MMVCLPLIAVSCFLSTLTFSATATPAIQQRSSSNLQLTYTTPECGQDEKWYTLSPKQRQVCVLNAPAFNAAAENVNDHTKMVCGLPVDTEAMKDLKSAYMLKGPNPEKSKKYIERLGRKLEDEKLYSKVMSIDKTKLSKNTRIKRNIISKLINVLKTKEEQARRGEESSDVQAYIEFEKNISPLQTQAEKLIGKMIENGNIRQHIISEAQDTSSLLRKLITKEQSDKIVSALKSLDAPSGYNSSPSMHKRSDSHELSKRNRHHRHSFVTGVVFGVFFEALGIFGVLLFIFIVLPFTIMFDLLQLFVVGIIFIGIILPFAIISSIFSPCF